MVRSIAEAECASELPLDFLELKGDMINLEAASFVAVSAHLRRLKLPIRSMTSPLPRPLKCRVVGGDADLPAALAVFRRMCTYAQELGIETVVFGSGQARNIPPGFPRDEALRQFREFFTAAASICRKHQMTLALEPLNRTETNFLNSCVETRQVIDQLNLANAQMVIDWYHIASEGLSLVSELEAAGAAIAHAQTSARPRHCRDVNPAEQQAFIAGLRSVGYNKTLSIECDFEDFARDAPLLANILRGLVA